MDNIGTVNRKARKEHKCDYCGSTIYKGEIYENQTNTDGGEIYEWKSCKHCEKIVERMWKDLGDSFGDGLNESHFLEYVKDNEIEFERR